MTRWAPVDASESAGLPDWEGHGGLPVGDYRPCRTAFEERFVNDPASSSRRAIYAGWNAHRDDLRRAGCNDESECLLNGSFTTSKQDPEDLDLVIGVPIEATTPADAIVPLLALLQGPDMRARYHCDAYPLFLLPEDHPDHANVTRKGIAYWLRWFGRDREGREKGRVWTRLAGLR